MPEKILIVDDDIDTLRLVGLMLERQGYRIVAASNGHQALSLATSEQPDLILLDVMMPEMDGIEVARQVRADPHTAAIPIIMFTAKSQVEDKLTGFEVGADDYLTKPTQPRELFAHVKAVLSRTTKARETIAPIERGMITGVIASKGGLGVTTVALNLGIAIHRLNQKTVIVADYRPGQSTISLELGFLKAEGFNRLLQRKTAEINPRAIESEIISHSSGVRLLLSSPQPRDGRFLSAVSNFEAITNHLRPLAQHIVLDLGCGLTPLTEKVLPLCDTVLIIIEPVPANVSQSKALISDLQAVGIGEGRIVTALINRVRSGMQLSLSQVQESLGRNISTVVTPAPELAYQAANQGVPILVHQPDGLTAQQFAKLASKIVEGSGGTAV